MLLAADPRLGPVVQRVGPCRLEPVWPGSVFAALLKAIVYQQLNGRAALTIFERVRRVFPDPTRLTPEGLARVSDEALRAAGLSRGKLAAVRDLAAHALAGNLPTLEDAANLDDEQIVARLTMVRGIGPWTAALVLLRGLGRLDVFPVNDSGAAASLAFVAGAPLNVTQVAEMLGQQRGMLYFCLLLALLEARGEIGRASDSAR